MVEESSNLDVAFKFADRRNAHSRKDLNAADRPDTNGWSKHWSAGAAHRWCAKKEAQSTTPLHGNANGTVKTQMVFRLNCCASANQGEPTSVTRAIE